MDKSSVGKSRIRLNQYKKLLNLTIKQKEILFGLLLGDCSIQTQNKGRSYRLKFEYGLVNKKYAEHFYELFEDWFLSPMKIRERRNKNEVLVTTLTFQTVSHEDFNFLASIFINEKGKKHIKQNLIKDYLTPLGLAYWFMDDGGKMDYGPNEGKGILLHTQGFNLEEVEFLSEGLIEKYNLICYPKLERKTQYMVAISGYSYETFLNLVKDHIIPFMEYKIPSPRKLKKINLGYACVLGYEIVDYIV